ncbi:MAG: hypothetical protein KDA84_10300, partial [Planctomycetaceae bacterium]|nr:hypothetical protein [Planctomycetaceae bacterium]
MTLSTKPRLKVLASSTKRIGVDIGTRAIKFVLVEQMREQWRVLLPLLIPYQCELPLMPEDVTQEFEKIGLREHLSLCSGSKMLSAHCVFSMGFSNTQAFPLPSASDSELRQIVEMELMDRLDLEPGQHVFDFW